METQIFRIVFEDDELLVIEKQKPFLSQRADSGSQEGIDEFIHRALKKPIFPVHRLDREVLGLMIFGKSKGAAEALSDQFKARTVRKLYLATVWGRVAQERQTLVHYLKKNPKNNVTTVFPRETEGAKRAELSYEVQERTQERTTLLVSLKTGRSHQIRAQLAKVGHPIVGDQRYGKARNAGVDEPIALYSALLGVNHPVSGERMTWALRKNLLGSTL
jgi:23S rRNA pseudouridine1911/1915/1917 synthase